MGQRISHKVEDRVEGGALLGGGGPVKVRISEGKFITEDEWNEDWKPEGANDYSYGSTLFAAKLAPFDPDDNEEDAVSQMWSCGKATRIVPSEDGEYLEVAEGSRGGGLPSGCARAVLEDSIIESGGSEDWLEAASGLDGAVVKVERVERTIKVKGKDQKVETLVVTEFIEEPGGKKRGKVSTKPKAGTKAKPKAEEEEESADFDLDTAAEEVLRAIAEEDGGTVLKGKLLSKIANLLATDDWEHYQSEKRAITKHLTDPKGTFLKGLDGVKVKGPKIEVEV